MPRILFAEDGLTVMSLSGGLFEDASIVLDVVTDGRSALDRLNAEPSAYDLVILGDDLPEISGFDCAAFIQKMYRRLPVLMLANRLDDDRMRHLSQVGIRKQHVMLKPTDQTSFAAWVHQALSEAPSRRSL